MKNTAVSILKTEVYNKLKIWDKKRAQVLKSHQKASQQIAQAIEQKIQQSKDFLNSIQLMVEERVNQLKAYCDNSVIDSDFVFQKNKNESYANHYQLLKNVFAVQTRQAKQASQKLASLMQIRNELQGIMDLDQSQSSSDNKNDQSVLIAKGNIKFLLQCQLPEIVEEVVKGCGKISKLYNEKSDEDFYFSIYQFVRLTRKQTNKHRQVGRQLLSYVSTSIKRQINLQTKIRSCLTQWATIDGPIDPIFVQQLSKRDPAYFVKDFYNIDELTDASYKESSLQDFLTKFEIQQFNEHERLKLCDVDGFYNSKIQTRIVITADGFMHLIRVNMFQPDFSLVLNPELVIKKNKECGLNLVQYKKKFYFKKEKEYQFGLQFNTEEDLHHVKTIIEKISQCKILPA